MADTHFSGVDVEDHDGSSAGLKLGGTLVTATAAEINVLDGITADVGELNILHGVTASTAELNTLDGASRAIKVLRAPLVAGTTTAGGDILSVANPEGAACIITRLIVNVTTEATGTPTADFGVAADGTTSSDTLLDGVDIGTAAALFDSGDATDQGTNGKISRNWASDEYVTGTPSATAAGLVGFAYIHYYVV